MTSLPYQVASRGRFALRVDAYLSGEMECVALFDGLGENLLKGALAHVLVG